MDHDVVIVGGSFAGLSAALQLARARRSVLVVDSGLPRNRFSHAAHGILGHDGRSPEEIRRLGREQLLAYPTARIVDARVGRITGEAESFHVEFGEWESVWARRIILAHGVADSLPDVEGLAACWGISVLHCPYCDGYENADKRIGVLTNDVMPVHQAWMLPDWSDDGAGCLRGGGHGPGDGERVDGDRRRRDDRRVDAHDVDPDDVAGGPCADEPHRPDRHRPSV